MGFHHPVLCHFKEFARLVWGRSKSPASSFRVICVLPMFTHGQRRMYAFKQTYETDLYKYWQTCKQKKKEKKKDEQWQDILQYLNSLRSAMGWLRLVGFVKFYVSFAKEPYKRHDILQKRPRILRSLLIVATPYRTYEWVMWHIWTIHVAHTIHVTPYLFTAHRSDNTFWQDILLCIFSLFIAVTIYFRYRSTASYCASFFLSFHISVLRFVAMSQEEKYVTTDQNVMAQKYNNLICSNKPKKCVTTDQIVMACWGKICYYRSNCYGLLFDL